MAKDKYIISYEQHSFKARVPIQSFTQTWPLGEGSTLAPPHARSVLHISCWTLVMTGRMWNISILSHIPHAGETRAFVSSVTQDEGKLFVDEILSPAPHEAAEPRHGGHGHWVGSMLHYQLLISCVSCELSSLDAGLRPSIIHPIQGCFRYRTTVIITIDAFLFHGLYLYAWTSVD